MQRFQGELEIDNERGVIYFHTSEAAVPTILRICQLGNIPKIGEGLLDITHMTSATLSGLKSTVSIPTKDKKRDVAFQDGVNLLKSLFPTAEIHINTLCSDMYLAIACVPAGSMTDDQAMSLMNQFDES